MTQLGSEPVEQVTMQDTERQRTLAKKTGITQEYSQSSSQVKNSNDEIAESRNSMGPQSQGSRLHIQPSLQAERVSPSTCVPGELWVTCQFCQWPDRYPIFFIVQDSPLKAKSAV